MANNRINRYIGAIALGIVLTAVPSCTDTWDDHYNADKKVSGTTNTLWDVIKSNPEYERFANIADNLFAYKRARHIVNENVFCCAGECVYAIFYGLPALCSTHYNF